MEKFDFILLNFQAQNERNVTKKVGEGGTILPYDENIVFVMDIACSFTRKMVNIFKVGDNTIWCVISTVQTRLVFHVSC